MEVALQNSPNNSEKKIVVVGQDGCGKSSLIASFVSETPVDMTRADHEDVRKIISFGRERVQVVLREVQLNQQEPLTRLMQYSGASVGLVCFAFNDAKSIRSVPKFIEELTVYSRLVDLSVVGCKLDLKHKTAVFVKEWLAIEKAMAPYTYLECSAKTGEGVSHLVRVVGSVLMDHQSKIRAEEH